MSAVYLKITSCEQCPHKTDERHYTGDSFEHVFKWFCRRTKRKDNMIGYEENGERPAIPRWCPLRKVK